MAITEGELGYVEGQESSLAVVVRSDADFKPDSADQRELVPAASGSRIEDLLMKVIEENRLLRLRLDQVETQSSWQVLE